MEALAEKFSTFLEKEKGLSDNTLQSYKRDIDQYINYLKGLNVTNLRNTNKTTIIAYLLHLQKLGRATSTISRNLASIRSFYQYLTKLSEIEEDPTVSLESPKVEKKLPQILSTKEVELLLEQPKCIDLKGYRDKAMLEILYATGIRVTELISLNIDDINLEMGFVRCNKGSRERMIPIGSIAINAIQEYLKNQEACLYREMTKKHYLLI
jgi:integrase/recombinase XerD